MKNSLFFFILFFGNSLAMEEYFAQGNSYSPYQYPQYYPGHQILWGYDADGNPFYYYAPVPHYQYQQPYLPMSNASYEEPVYYPTQPVPYQESPVEKIKTLIRSIAQQNTQAIEDDVHNMRRLIQEVKNVDNKKDRNEIGTCLDKTGLHLLLTTKKSFQNKNYDEVYTQLINLLYGENKEINERQQPQSLVRHSTVSKKKKNRIKNQNLPPFQLQFLTPSLPPVTTPAFPVVPEPISQEVLPEEKQEEILSDDTADCLDELPEDIQQQLRELDLQRKKAASDAPSHKKKKKKNKVKKIGNKPKPNDTRKAKSVAPALPLTIPIVTFVESFEEQEISLQEKFNHAKSLCGDNNSEGITQLEDIIKNGNDSEIQHQAALYLARLYDPLVKNKKNKLPKDSSVALSWYKKAGNISPEIIRNALLLSIALKDQDEITTWLRKGDELAINPLDPTILAARAVGMLLQSDYQGAAAFFSQLIKNKKNISADYYDLYFPLINKWLTDNIDRFMEAEIHADEEYVSMAMYALGKMFIEGSEKWKNQSKEGWLYQKNENDEFPQQVTAFDLINKAKDMGYPPAMYYLVTQESMLPDEVRMRYIKSIFDQEKDVFTQEEINTIRSMLTTKVEKDNNIPAGVLLAYDAYKKGKLSGWLKKHDSYATTLFQDIKTLSQAMHYCSQHCFQELSKKAAAIIGIDLFERIQQELETIAQETQINLPHIRKHLAIADVQVERQTSDETEIKLKILYDTKGSNFDRFISIPRKKKTQGNLPPLVVEDPPLDDFFQKIHAHNQQCNQQGRVAWALFDLAEKSFQKQEYEASVEFIDKAITSLCFLQHLMVSQDQNKQIKFNGMLVTLGQQKNKSIQDTIGRIQRKQEEYTKSISAEEITKARNYYQKIALLHTQFMKIKKNRSKKNIAFKKLKEELEEIPAIKAMLSAQEENDDERMREIKNRNLDQKILNYLGREFLASHYRIDQLCGLDFSQRVPATKVPTTTEAVEMSEVIPLPKDSVENSRSLDNNNKDSEPKKGYPKIIIQSYKDPHDLCDALKMIASIEDQLETGDNS